MIIPQGDYLEEARAEMFSQGSAISMLLAKNVTKEEEEKSRRWRK
jgi:hypothetical protein